MYALRAHVDKMHQETKEAEKEGEAVAWCMLDGGYGSHFLSARGINSVFASARTVIDIKGDDENGRYT